MDVHGTIQIADYILTDIKGMIDTLNSEKMRVYQNEQIGTADHITFTMAHYRLEKFLTSLGFEGTFIYSELARRNMDYSEKYTSNLAKFTVSLGGVLIDTELIEEWEDDSDGPLGGGFVSNQYFRYSIKAVIQL